MLTDDQFKQALADSQPSVDTVQKWLLVAKGIEAVKPDVPWIDSHKERAEIGDPGDLLWYDRGVTKIIQVKHRMKMNFTGAGDYPHHTIMVDEVWKYDRFEKRHGTPLAYVIVDRPIEHWIWVPVKETRPKWRIESRYDRRSKRPVTTYTCPRGLVEGGSFSKHSFL